MNHFGKYLCRVGFHKFRMVELVREDYGLVTFTRYKQCLRCGEESLEEVRAQLPGETDEVGGIMNYGRNDNNNDEGTRAS